MIATLVGFAAHFTSALTLGLAAGRVPWSNMYEFTLTANAGRLYTLGGSIVVTVGELPDGVTGYVTGPLTVFRTEVAVSSTTAPDTNRHVAVAERTVAPAVEQVMHGGQWHPAIKVTEGGGASV